MRFALPVIAAALVSTAAFAQPVEVAPLAAPDVFSGGSRDTGLGDDLWRGASADLARSLIPAIDPARLTPAGKALAVRLLSTGANAPDGAGNDLALAAARGRALLKLGEPGAANAAVERIPHLATEPALAEAAADAALLTGAPYRACRIEQNLTADRGAIYWLRLRGFCQAIAGDTAAAQLSLTLAAEKARDPVFSRLMTAVLVGGEAGAASTRTPLETALSRRLGLISAPAAPAPPVVMVPDGLLTTDPVAAARLYLAAGDLDQARALRAAMTQDVVPGAQPGDLDLLDAALAAASGQGRDTVLDTLVGRGQVGNRSAQLASLYLAALGTPMDAEARADFAGFDLGRSAAPPARLAALQMAADHGLKGETALLALGIAGSAGKEGLSPADRAAVIRALTRAGLAEDARAFAVEGVLALPRK
ncbi:MAG TPA: hypothetical protein VEA44_03375 [Caulobacter sp.]|nr:hypothetical protein [Caulobacter sp.]